MRIIFLIAVIIIVVESCKDPNCANCLRDPNDCKSCRPGYRLTQGHCQPCDDPNCSQCN